MGAANISSPKKDAMDLAKDLALAYGEDIAIFMRLFL